MRSPSVLVACRNGRHAEPVCSLLSSAGFEVITAAGGVDCVDRLRDHSPDLLVLDPALLWGGWDGVLERLGEDESLPSVPVLFLPHPAGTTGPPPGTGARTSDVTVS